MEQSGSAQSTASSPSSSTLLSQVSRGPDPEPADEPLDTCDAEDALAADAGAEDVPAAVDETTDDDEAADDGEPAVDAALAEGAVDVLDVEEARTELGPAPADGEDVPPAVDEAWPTPDEEREPGEDEDTVACDPEVPGPATDDPESDDDTAPEEPDAVLEARSAWVQAAASKHNAGMYRVRIGFLQRRSSSR